MVAYRLKEILVDSPIGIVRAYVARILVDEMGTTKFHISERGMLFRLSD